MSTFSYSDFTSLIENFDTRYKDSITEQSYFGFPIEPILAIEHALLDTQVNNVAYFSMEYGLAPSVYNGFTHSASISPLNTFGQHDVFSNLRAVDNKYKMDVDKTLDIPIYGGGLGVLAGDILKSAADMGYTMAGLGILWNKGYFQQKLWYGHGQIAKELNWDPYTYPGLIPLKTRIDLPVNEGTIRLRPWKYYVYSHDKKYACPLILLDANLEENEEKFRPLTDQLYRSDDVWWKILQRLILGIGGMRALKAFQYKMDLYHLNEGHAAFAISEVYKDLHDKTKMHEEKDNFAYTCHTPVAAGHDRFSISDLEKFLDPEHMEAALLYGKEHPEADFINLTHMCMSHCGYVNAVAQRHGEITRLQFPAFKSKIESITNGIHIHTWISDSFKQLFDMYSNTIGPWQTEPACLKRIKQLRLNTQFRKDIFQAHQANKRQLVALLNRWYLDENILTVGWARRFAGYKRPRLIFQDLAQLKRLASRYDGLQIILAGKAHPNDNIAADHLKNIMDYIESLNEAEENIKIILIENYDTHIGKILTNSVDIWLNNPLPPFEASGTSGMKAMLNGVPQLTTLDGWIVEVKDADIGWTFGYEHQGNAIGSEQDLHLAEDSKALYNTLEQVARLYYQTNDTGKIDVTSTWIDKMIHCCERASYFNTQRVVREYNERMWLREVLAE